MLAKVDSNDTETVISALIAQARKRPNELDRSPTGDRSREMTDHKRFILATDIQVYFCDPQSPWQRGSNESTSRSLLQVLPERHGPFCLLTSRIECGGWTTQ